MDELTKTSDKGGASLPPVKTMMKYPNKICDKGRRFPLVKVMSYNICRAFKTEGSDFAFENRQERILEVIINHNPDIIMFQEFRRFVDYSREDSIETFARLLEEHGYEVQQFKTNGTPLCLVNCICFKREKFFMVSRDTKFLSDTPDIPSPGWGNGFGRSVGRMKLYPVGDDGKIQVDCLFGVCVTHFSLPEDARDKEARLLHKLLYDDVPTIFSGDFNLFGERAKEQRAILFSGPSVSDACAHVKGTWLGYRDDFPVTEGQVGEKLDGLAGYGPIVWHGETIVDTHHYRGADDSRPTLVGGNPVNNCPSDHAPIIASFTVDDKTAPMNAHYGETTTLPDGTVMYEVPSLRFF